MGGVSRENPTHEAAVDLAALATVDSRIDPTILGVAEYDFPALAEASGWDLADLKDLCLWSGTPPANPGERVYTQLDLDGLVAFREMAEKENFSSEDVGYLARSLSYSMERLALTQVEAIIHRLTQRGMSDTEARVAAAAYAPSQNQALMHQLNVMWQRHFSAAIHRLTTETILLRGISDDDRQFPLVVAVGQARIADFTEITANFGVEDYAEFVQDFANRTSDVVNSTDGGRVVKLLGDTIVWVTPNADAGAEIALKIADLHHQGFAGQLQTALTWCRVMSLHGDLFGPGANLAAKLAELAPIGEVFVDDAAATQFVRSAKYTVTPQPEIQIKGLGEVRPWILTPTH